MTENKSKFLLQGIPNEILDFYRIQASCNGRSTTQEIIQVLKVNKNYQEKLLQDVKDKYKA